MYTQEECNLKIPFLKQTFHESWIYTFFSL